MINLARCVRVALLSVVVAMLTVACRGMPEVEPAPSDQLLTEAPTVVPTSAPASQQLPSSPAVPQKPGTASVRVLPGEKTFDLKTTCWSSPDGVYIALGIDLDVRTDGSYTNNLYPSAGSKTWMYLLIRRSGAGLIDGDYEGTGARALIDNYGISYHVQGSLMADQAVGFGGDSDYLKNVKISVRDGRRAGTVLQDEGLAAGQRSGFELTWSCPV
ncbi:hypothetical protein OG400_19105 [Micromonospora ureilytica]|uniref:hypothetical protein n=1 Tax=Micromonospora ureilytica TaxID=709868 RepID=UPI002E0E6913|nr:hypothetical protein OG400_19105 [Micromonospora ureilytica]